MDNKEKASWLAGLLTGWGIKESWAKIIAGAIIGALAAIGTLTQTSCTLDYSQTAAGDLSFSTSLSPMDVATDKFRVTPQQSRIYVARGDK